MTDDDTGSSPYLMFSGDTTEDAARLAFIRRFHQEPAKVMRLYGANRELFVGPVPKQDD